MQQPQKSAAKTEAWRYGIFGLEVEGAVVQPQLFQGVAQPPMLVRFYRIQAREHHGFRLLKAGQRLGGLVVLVHDVSPICASDTVLILANRNPASPELGVKGRSDAR